VLLPLLRQSLLSLRLPPPPFVAAGVGAGAGVSVDLDEEAGYGIDGGEISSMAAVRATAASHSNCQLEHTAALRAYLL
jgi:hypothetical protein